MELKLKMTHGISSNLSILCGVSNAPDLPLNSLMGSEIQSREAKTVV